MTQLRDSCLIYTVTVKKNVRTEFWDNFFVRFPIPLRFVGLGEDACPQLFQQKSKEKSPTRRRTTTFTTSDSFLKLVKLHVGEIGRLTLTLPVPEVLGGRFVNLLCSQKRLSPVSVRNKGEKKNQFVFLIGAIKWRSHLQSVFLVSRKHPVPVKWWSVS